METAELTKAQLNGSTPRRIEVHTGLAPEGREKIANHLNQVLADTYALFLKTQNYHWNVRGVEFKTIHELTEEKYTEMFKSIDVIAERIRSLGHNAPGTFEEYQSMSGILPALYDVSSMHMCKDLCEDHETLAQNLRSAMSTASKYKDEATIDMLTANLRFHEKSAWMWRSMIEK